jgi:hypothetical protein
MLAALAFAPALANGFVLDDGTLLVNNPFVRSLDGLPALLTRELFAASGEPRFVPFYRPVSGLVYWLSWQLFGANAWLQHALNVVLHGCAAACLLRALHALGLRLQVAFAMALLFAVHPATADIVAYLGGRQDLVGWIAVLLAVPAVARETRWGLLLAIVLGASLSAALAREFFLVTPALLLPLTLVRPTRAERWTAACTVLGAGAASVAGVLALRALVGVGSTEALLSSPLHILGSSAWIAAHLAQLLVWPVGLAVDSTVVPFGPWATGVTFATATLVLGAPMVAAWRRDRPAAAVIATGAVVLGAVVSVHTIMAVQHLHFSDRYAYGAVVGLALLLAGALQLLARSPRVQSRAAAYPWLRWAPAVVVVLVPLSWARAVEWRSEDTLAMAMLRVQPDDAQTALAVGMRLFANGNVRAAYPHCLAYRQRRPMSDRANLCLATHALEISHNPRAAADLLEPFVQSRPGHVRARMTLLRALFLAKDLDRVRQWLDFLLQIEPQAEDLLAAERIYRSLTGKRPQP